jgi:hypothetical protein
MLGFAPLCVLPLCVVTLTEEDPTTSPNDFIFMTSRDIAGSVTSNRDFEFITTDRALPTVFTTTRTFPEING